MGRVRWLGRNVDGVVALLVVGVITAVDIFWDIPPDKISKATIFVLGVVVVAMLRDRTRNEEAEKHILEAGKTLPAFAGGMGRLDALGGQVDGLTRAVNELTMVRALTWPEVSLALAEARRDTDRWVFRGGTGTYIRAVTLPEIIANARRERRALLVRLEIIDPMNEEACRSYVRFRKALTGETEWTFDRTRREALATVLAACYHRQRFDLLDIEVGLSQGMPTLRWDLSARHLVITQEGPGPALLVESGKLMYDYFNTELRKSLEQARRVPIELARDIQLSDEPTDAEVRRLFSVLNLALPRSFTATDVADIVRRALHAKNDYDR